jgi:hypothetical protein
MRHNIYISIVLSTEKGKKSLFSAELDRSECIWRTERLILYRGAPLVF